MIVVWILSYLAAFMLGALTLFAAFIISSYRDDKKAVKTLEFMHEYVENPSDTLNRYDYPTP